MRKIGLLLLGCLMDVVVVCQEKKDLPLVSCGQLIEHENFSLSYCEGAEQAEWVAYTLEKKDVLKSRKRTDNFRPDSKIVTGSAQLVDYRGSGFDRGHLAPAADMKATAMSISESFLMSNMSPQRPGFNRGIWKRLESKVREWAIARGEVLVITGPVLASSKTSIGENQVAVPEMYYKVVVDLDEEPVQAISFLLPNEKSDRQLLDFSVSIDSIESVSGIDFFAAWPDQLEAEVESRTASAEWQ